MTALQAPPPVARVSPGLYMPEPARVMRAVQLTALESLYEVAFMDRHELGHQPGQFVQVSILGVGECPISLCSSPTRHGTFELCIRRVGEVTTHIHRLAAGDVIGVRGPLGHGFDVASMHGRDMLVVAGGCGLAPARSLVQYILDQRARFGEFALLYGCRSPKELLFADDIRAWQARRDMECHVTVEHSDDSWKGETGLVTRLFRKLRPLNPEQTIVVVVGPPVMFKFVVMEVLARRVPQKNVYCSLERRMKCGVGKCGHCQANDVYVCTEGPVFRYGQLKALREAIE